MVHHLVRHGEGGVRFGVGVQGVLVHNGQRVGGEKTWVQHDWACRELSQTIAQAAPSLSLVLTWDEESSK